ncbi:MAG: hypothetical protein C4617_04820 [Candidatus Liberibacter europaeus]|uniref:Uncharacterized protein n=1 Tax=Candidatus Liberibacter europaeus TaxID=744859 RepID=A0A2T4VWN6_9HYPH|nr:hypothetical protein [Candidatus Liberibacter europaeus]PTL86194.1 MAG: hypothetical protein C4617_04820 [Candidatus Liberibacter europaeus]
MNSEIVQKHKELLANHTEIIENHFELIAKLIKAGKENHIEILRRNKDNPEVKVFTSSIDHMTKRVTIEIELQLDIALSPDDLRRIEDGLRHIELEAKKAVKELLQPLMKTIRNIETKDLNKSSNPDEDVCESNGTSESCPESN